MVVSGNKSGSFFLVFILGIKVKSQLLCSPSQFPITKSPTFVALISWVVNEGSLKRSNRGRNKTKQQVKLNPYETHNRKGIFRSNERAQPTPSSPLDTFSAFLTHRVSLESLVRRDYEASKGASLFWQHRAFWFQMRQVFENRSACQCSRLPSSSRSAAAEADQMAGAVSQRAKDFPGATPLRKFEDAGTGLPSETCKCHQLGVADAKKRLKTAPSGHGLGFLGHRLEVWNKVAEAPV